MLSRIKQGQSPAVKVLFGELLRHKKVAIATLVVTVLDAGLVFGLSPYIISLFAEKVTKGQIHGAFHDLAWIVAVIAIVHAVLFFLRIRWRRFLTARGRTGLSRRLNATVARADVDATRGAGNMQGETQKLQDAWLDLVAQMTEVFVPFICGSLSLFIFVAVRAPMFALPILALVAGGALVAGVTAREFSAKNRLMSDVAARERGFYEAMFAVSRMKWLIAKLSPLREEATLQHETAFYDQAKHHARWQSVLLALGGMLQFVAISSGPALTEIGYSPSVAVLIVLLGYALGEKFLSITQMLCMYDWILFRANPVAIFVSDVEERIVRPPLPRDAIQSGVEYRFDGAVAVYGEGESRVVLPNITISPGITILRGASGSGKTTLLGVSDGSITYEGSVRLGGYELREWDISGVVVNGSQSFGSMDVSLDALCGSDVDEKLRDLALMCSAYPEVDLQKSLGSLSGGQQRRAMLAAIIYHTLTGGYEDGVLFIDEPTNDLGAREIRSLIQGFRRLSGLMPNLAIVITTHEGRLVRLADRLIALLGEGTALVKYRDGERLVVSCS